jgi:serine/threonine protein kinase
MPMPGLEGQRIRDWEIEGLLGEGGMGQVWRARHTLLNRVFAIKVISRELLSDPKFEALFIREAGTQAELQHPHIIPATDFFVEDGLHCLVMPYLEGQSLEDRLESHKDPETGKRLPLPQQEAIAIALQVLHALDYAHQHRVIHRDVKPSNILLDRRGDAYLTDFGVALKMDKPRTTSTGKVVGTSAYMSPEQIQRPREMDHRTDVYSFGCVLYEMLAGGPVFETSEVEGDTDFYIKESHIKRMPDPLRQRRPEVPAAVESVVTKALAKSPNDRFSGCGEFARELLKTVDSTDSLIRCANCGTKNKIEKPDQIANSKCTNCNRLLLTSVGTKTRASKSSVWIITTVLLAIASIITIIGWGVTADRRKRAENQLYSTRSERDALQSQKSTLSTELENVKKERQTLIDKVNRYETAPATIVVTNSSTIQVRYLYMNKKDESYGTDRLGSSVLDPGGTKRFQVSPGTYKVQLKDKDGKECNYTDINVSAGSTKTMDVKNDTPSATGCRMSLTLTTSGPTP